VEASERSGTLTTVNQALEQGREVFAVPGNVLSPASKGPNALIQSGARVATSADDILNVLGIDAAVERAAPENSRESLPVAANETEAALLRNLSLEPSHIDELSHRSGLPIRLVSSALTMLELKGLVRQVGIMQYALVRGPR